MTIREIRSTAPNELMRSLGDVKLSYTEAISLYHCVALGMGDSYCGVFGDGDNAAYEWFIWRGGSLRTSNVAYGSPEVALRDVLIEALS